MPKADTNPITPDPVAEIGRRLVAVLEALDRNAVASFDAGGGEKARLDDEEDMLLDMQNFLEEAASQRRATSLAGAMLQVMIVHIDVESVVSHAGREEEARCRTLRRRMHRCLYSVLSALAAASGTDPKEVGGDFYMTAKFDPHGWLDTAFSA